MPLGMDNTSDGARQKVHQKGNTKNENVNIHKLPLATK